MFNANYASYSSQYRLLGFFFVCLIAVSAGSATHDDDAEALSLTGTCSKDDSACSSSNVAGVSLLQTRAHARKTQPQKVKAGDTLPAANMEEEEDVSLLKEDEQQLQGAWKFEEKLPIIIAGAVSALTQVTPLFEKKLPAPNDDKPDPGAIVQGIAVLGEKLYDIFHEGFLELVEKDTPGFDWKKFRKNWIEMFQRIPNEVQEVDKLLKEFSEEGKTGSLILAISRILDRALTDVKSFMPKSAQADVEKYFQIVTRTTNSIGESWAAFESGDGVKGAEALWKGVKGNVDDLLPQKLQNDNTYKAIMSVVDDQMSKLSETVMKFKKKMTESRVCIKKKLKRRSKYSIYPTVCPSGMMRSNDRKFCDSQGGAMSLLMYLKGQKKDSEVASADEEADDTEDETPEHEEEDHQEIAKEAVRNEVAALLKKRAGVSTGTESESKELEESLEGKGGNKNRVKAQCKEDPGTKYPDLHNGRCYKRCPNGFESAEDKCIEECEEPFPAEKGTWCGKTEIAISQAEMQMVLSAVNAVASIAISIASAANAGDKDALEAANLSGTIDALTNAALAFVFPKCKLKH